MNSQIGFLCSGELGFHCLKMLEKHLKLQFIFTDKNSHNIIEYAQNNKIPHYIGNPREENAAKFLDNFKTDLIFSINYLFIVNQNILKHPNNFAINFHGSLLPKYRGRTPHVWAIINGESETGITAHIMEERCDTGDIVLQEKVKIGFNNSGADILQKFKDRYPEMIKEIIYLIKNNKLNKVKQDNKNATSFGKRTPKDGKINWNWQRERIRNWVRAQKYPYPGAFTLLNGEKVIIDEIRFSELGFNDVMPNGLIIDIQPRILVKTPNGVVELSIIRNENQVIFNKNDQFL